MDIKTRNKRTETFQYTHFTLCHPLGVKRGFIKGEAISGIAKTRVRVTQRLRVRVRGEGKGKGKGKGEGKGKGKGKDEGKVKGKGDC